MIYAIMSVDFNNLLSWHSEKATFLLIYNMVKKYAQEKALIGD